MKVPVAAAAMLAAVSCSGSDRSPLAPSETSAGSSMPAIVAFGDSLTAGRGLAPDQSYPAVLQRKLEAAGYRYHVINSGVTGETTADGLRRIDRALATPDARVLILAMGANDGLRGVALDSVRRNLSAMIERAQARGVRVLLCGMETPPLHGVQYSLDFHFLFPDLAAKYRVALVPFMLNGVFGRADLNLSDGIHPNAEGAALVAENIYPYVLPLLSATVFTY
jgi:acyl-CoA thioesterase-1